MAFKDIFRPKWKHSDPHKQIDAIEKIDDQDKLAMIASKIDDWYLATKIIERIVDQKHLELIANTNPDGSVQEKAIEKIDDQDLLLSIALKKTDYLRGLAAIKKIHSKTSLKKIACSHESAEIASIASERISERVMLQEIAESASHVSIREDATTRIAILSEQAENRKELDAILEKSRAASSESDIRLQITKFIREFDQMELNVRYDHYCRGAIPSVFHNEETATVTEIVSDPTPYLIDAVEQLTTGGEIPVRQIWCYQMIAALGNELGLAYLERLGRTEIATAILRRRTYGMPDSSLLRIIREIESALLLGAEYNRKESWFEAWKKMYWQHTESVLSDGEYVGEANEPAKQVAGFRKKSKPFVFDCLNAAVNQSDSPYTKTFRDLIAAIEND
ncbi:MAG: hypothetical protein GY854_21870 [Deltaproteobacteria bacterium]|nr:hypothetical protein [Deltaproteobacteria bacterium]